MSATDSARPDLSEYWRRLQAFLRYLLHRFEADHCMRAAAALAYTSLLALVPLFTVVFITLSAFPAFQAWRQAIESFVFQNFVPALGDQVQTYLGEFTDKARGLQAAGIAILLVTVLAMMSTIESTFNRIWGIRKKRPLFLRFVVYWSVLTLGPVLIGAGMVATSYVISLPLLSDGGVGGGFKTRLIAVVPLIATTIAFVLFFKLIPYRPVPLKHALIGGIVASVLFEIAKRAFALFVTQFPSQQAVYGAFATVPIFLTWIYLSWVIVLLGAEITQCLTTFRSEAARRQDILGPGDPMYCAFRVLLRLYQAQADGYSLSEKDLLARETDFGYTAINSTLALLDRANWISRNEAYEWVLTRDLGRVSLLDLLHRVPSFPRLDNVRAMAADDADEHLREKLVTLGLWAEDALRVPLAELMASRHEGIGAGVTRNKVS